MFSKLANPLNYQEIRRKESDIKYLVIHYTGNDGDTARGNLTYFHENVVGASAHFFVDDKEVCCSVPWYFRAWHCGTRNGYRHEDCRNANSIGIELCSRKAKNGSYYFTEETMNRAAAFIAQQMKNYSVPIERVLRHFDVTGKYCPRPFVDEFAWEEFKYRILSFYYAKGGDSVTYYEQLKDIPAGEQRKLIEELVNRGIIKGNDKGLHLSSDMVRMFVFLRRMEVI